MLRDETRFFPGPQAHALTILESCSGLDEAKWLAAINYRSSNTVDEVDHWISVLAVLSPKAELWN